MISDFKTEVKQAKNGVRLTKKVKLISNHDRKV